MEKENQAPVEQSTDTSGEVEQSGKDSVSLSSYQKVLKEKKARDAKLSEYEAKLQKLEEERLEKDGKLQELLESYKKKTTELETRLEKTNKQYAWSTLTGEIKREALKFGCKDPDKLIKLMSDDDLRTIEVGENFSINPASLKEVIEKNKKENFFLFDSSPKQAAPGIPSTKIEKPDKSLKDMSLDELKDMYKKIKSK